MTPLLPDGELLARLISFPTVSCRPNEALLDWVADYLDRPGIRLTRQDGPEPGKANLVALAGPETADPTAEGTPPREGLTLSGHVDVVPAVEEGWTTDPFEMAERDGRYWGRGVCDMKGFCALAVNRIAGADPDRLRRPLALLLTFDEELSCVGAHHFARNWDRSRPLPGNVLVGEPTSLQAVRMHKGHLKLRVTIRGRSAHTGSPHLGINAVHAAAPVLSALDEVRRRWERERTEHADRFPDVPFAVLAVSGIRGGEAPNIVPDRCEIDVGVRVMPGSSPRDAVEEVRRAVSAAAGPTTVEVEEGPGSPPLLTPEDAPLHRAICGLKGQDRSLGVPFATDGGWLSTAGYECVVFGPGSIDVAHKPDEHLPIGELREAGRHLDALIASFCLADGGEG